MRKGQLAAAWGLGGFSVLILMALVRLTGMALEALAMGLSTLQWGALALNVAFMAYAEGYRGFQKSFVPKMIERLRRLANTGTLAERWLAPLFCLGLFNVSRRQLILSYALTAMIIAFVVLFQTIPQPWRGVLDAGVVVGLAWGLMTTWGAAWKAWPYQDLNTGESINDPHLLSTGHAGRPDVGRVPVGNRTAGPGG